jgi:hypothetical protein
VEEFIVAHDFEQPLSVTSHCQWCLSRDPVQRHHEPKVGRKPVERGVWFAVTRLRRPAIKLDELIEDTSISKSSKPSECVSRSPPDPDVYVSHESVEKPRYSSGSLGWNVSDVPVVSFGRWNALNEPLSVACYDPRRIVWCAVLPDHPDERVYGRGIECINMAFHPLE